MLRSANVVLDLTLTASPSPVVIGGTAVKALIYNGSLPGPTRLVRPGDAMTVSLANRMNEPTNLHSHGLRVSPEGSSENVFRRIDPGTTAEYRYQIPANHPPGVLWYDPHHHGMAARQVLGGSMMRFTIDRRAFDAARIAQSVAADAIEEWTIVNTSPMDHPFHLHFWPMQLFDIGGKSVKTPTWQDVVNVPPHSRSRVRIAFEDFTGTAVYHCPILDHEDDGMMGVISVS